MSAMQAIIEHLTAAGVADGRVFVNHAPQGTQTPYVTLTQTSGSEGMTLAGDTDGLAQMTLDADSYGLSYAEAAGAAQAVKDELHTLRGIAGTGTGRRNIRHCRLESEGEDAVRERGEASDRWLHRVTRGFILWHRAATS